MKKRPWMVLIPVVAALGCHCHPVGRTKNGFCLYENGECFESSPIEVHPQIANRLGCIEKCFETPDCLWWTWYEASSTSPYAGQCHVFSSCAARNVTCHLCFTGERSCYSECMDRAVAILGGQQAIADVEVLNLEGHCHQTLVPSVPDSFLTANRPFAASLGTKIYLCGGSTSTSPSSCLFFDLYQSQWNPIVPDMRTPRVDAAMVTAYGQLHVFGGRSLTRPLSSVETFNEETNTWTSLSELRRARFGHCAARVNDVLFVIGGATDDGVILQNQVIEAWDATTMLWKNESFAIPIVPRWGHSCIAFNDGILMAGGVDQGGRILSSVEVFHPSTNNWTSMPPMLTRRSSFGLSILNDNVVVAVGGIDEHGQDLETAEKFSEETNEWQAATPLELYSARSNFAVATLPVDQVAGGCS